jgi:hypothetical protein
MAYHGYQTFDCEGGIFCKNGATLMVVHPAFKRPVAPSLLKAERMTAPQNGATSSDQSAVFTSCKLQNPKGLLYCNQLGKKQHISCVSHMSCTYLHPLQLKYAAIVID